MSKGKRHVRPYNRWKDYFCLEPWSYKIMIRYCCTVDDDDDDDEVCDLKSKQLPQD